MSGYSVKINDPPVPFSIFDEDCGVIDLRLYSVYSMYGNDNCFTSNPSEQLLYILERIYNIDIDNKNIFLNIKNGIEQAIPIDKWFEKYMIDILNQQKIDNWLEKF